jgi:hemerythrin superfamily protein
MGSLPLTGGPRPSPRRMSAHRSPASPRSPRLACSLPPPRGAGIQGRGSLRAAEAAPGLGQPASLAPGEADATQALKGDGSMNAIALLRADHERVKSLFRTYETYESEEREPQRKQVIAEQIFTELEVHSQIEEEIFYPAVRAKADQEGQDLVAESLEDHQAVEALIEILRTLDPRDEEYAARFEELMDTVEAHIEDEEEELFPEAEERLSDALERLGTRMQERKKAVLGT